MSGFRQILLVDDDPDWRMLLSELISDIFKSCEILEAENGRQAMDLLNGKNEIALIFLDAEMPCCDGFQFLQDYRRESDRRVPVIMLSGLEGDEIRQRALDGGASEYFTKPDNPKALWEFLMMARQQWWSVPQSDQEASLRIVSPRILVVEDDPDQQMLIEEVLNRHFRYKTPGNVIAVASGGEALGYDLKQFDVVLLDYNLPDISGLELLSQILSRSDVPVIFVTGENCSTLAAEAISCGAQDYMTKLGDYLFALPLMVEKNIRLYRIKKENYRLQKRLEQMLSQLRVKNSQLRESMEKLRIMADTDPLTGLANRRSFAEILDKSHSEAVRYGYDLTCCMCDLDHYKQLNDTLGHQVGDKVLSMTAEIIHSMLRYSDVAARYGGDEFVLLFPHTGVEDAIAVVDRIRCELILRASNYGRFGQQLSMSIGVASIHNDAPRTGDELVSLADKALYLAKQQGKNRVALLH